MMQQMQQYRAVQRCWSDDLRGRGGGPLLLWLVVAAIACLLLMSSFFQPEMTTKYMLGTLTSFSSLTDNNNGNNNNENNTKMLLDRLSAHVQRVWHRLQHPTNCSTARLMVCPIAKHCGLGCYLNHFLFCLTMAAAANRTLMLEKDGREWSYKGGCGWECVFQPITSCPYNENLPTNRSDRVAVQTLWHQIFDIHKLAHRPPVMPTEFADILPQLHPDPALWFLGQTLLYLWRANADTMAVIKHLELKIPFDEGPIVGIHVRRSDKKFENAYHPLNEYMKWVHRWFDANEENSANFPRRRRRVFIASDDPAVLVEARKHWGARYEFYTNEQAAQLAPTNYKEYNIQNAREMVAEITVLARCRYVVCTFSSNVCKMVYVLMQTHNSGDAINRVQSLDYPFYLTGRSQREFLKPDVTMESVVDDGNEAASANATTSVSKAVEQKSQWGNDSVLAVQIGDTVAVVDVDWDRELVLGTNERTGQRGHIPLPMLKRHLRAASFPIFGDGIPPYIDDKNAMNGWTENNNDNDMTI